MSNSSEIKNICILRLSAIGDCVNLLGVVQELKKQKPNTNIYWIIGKTEHKMFAHVKDITFIPYDKKAGLKGILDVRKQIKDIKFDYLFHMQSALRASIISIFIHAKHRLGFDKIRAKDGQQFFTNQKVKSPTSMHVIDGFIEFIKAVGCSAPNYISYDLNITNDEYKSVEEFTRYKKIAVISPCTSKDYKNWTIDGYIDITKYLITLNFQVLLCGGNSSLEKMFSNKILDSIGTQNLNYVTSLIGKTNLRQLAAVISKSHLVISPDSASTHIANAFNIPVIGLYAHHNPLRVGPYKYLNDVVSVYNECIKLELKKNEKIQWRTRVKDPNAMKKITSKQVIDSINLIINKYKIF